MQSFFFFYSSQQTLSLTVFFVFGHFRHVGFDSAIKFNLITITLVRRCHVKTTKARSGRSLQSRKRNVRHIPLSHIQLISAQTQTHTHTHIRHFHEGAGLRGCQFHYGGTATDVEYTSAWRGRTRHMQLYYFTELSTMLLLDSTYICVLMM